MKTTGIDRLAVFEDDDYWEDDSWDEWGSDQSWAEFGNGRSDCMRKQIAC